MRVLVDNRSYVTHSSRSAQSVSLRDTTTWGFSVAEPPVRILGSNIFEKLLKTAGFVMVPIGAAFPFVQGSSSGTSEPFVDLIVAIVIIVIGVLLSSCARKGFRAQVQLDKSLR